jgi:hypothetical protein
VLRVQTPPAVTATDTPSEEERMTEIVTPKQAFATELDGVPVVVNPGDHFPKGHPITKGRSEMFRPVEDKLGKSSADRVLDATARRKEAKAKRATAKTAKRSTAKAKRGSKQVEKEPGVEQATAGPGEKRAAKRSTAKSAETQGLKTTDMPSGSKKAAEPEAEGASSPPKEGDA